MKIVTLCSCGLGTCFLLKMRVEEYAREAGIPVTVIPCDLSSAPLEHADLYVMPFGLDTGSAALFDAPAIVIEDLLDPSEIRQKLASVLRKE